MFVAYISYTLVSYVVTEKT